MDAYRYFSVSCKSFLACLDWGAQCVDGLRSYDFDTIDAADTSYSVIIDLSRVVR